MPHPKGSRIDLHNIFLGLQTEMAAALETAKKNILHAPTIGAATELRWLKMFQAYLPERYKADQAFVLDSQGRCSEQLDIVIFDRHYSPFLFKQEGARYVPAESVYAVIEARQDLRRETISYAGQKAASVRRLTRTSVDIPHAGGVYKAKAPFRILAGVVALGERRREDFSRPFERLEPTIAALPDEARIDFGCSLKTGAFEVDYRGKRRPVIRTSDARNALISFFLTLLSRLQQLATVPALDFSAYMKSLKS
jgi:hypothetical protein